MLGLQAYFVGKSCFYRFGLIHQLACSWLTVNAKAAALIEDGITLANQIYYEFNSTISNKYLDYQPK